jgi:hypothetical protein
MSRLRGLSNGGRLRDRDRRAGGHPGQYGQGAAAAELDGRYEEPGIDEELVWLRSRCTALPRAPLPASTSSAMPCSR